MAASLYIALFAFAYVVLALHVIKGRRAFKVAVGDGGNDVLRMRIRAHGNFSEYVPLFLLMLMAAEYNGLSALAVHGFGAFFAVARGLHVYGLLKDEAYEGDKRVRGGRYRFRAMQGTFAVIGVLAGTLLVQFVSLQFF
ncbi:MAG: hypothetical protein GC131_07415 [Alphaproteobacteria bacterium]|nr:hypothetical protein [Alphaproteobacteria bacterium]